MWRPRPGVFAQTVVCKVTFELAAGLSRLAPLAAGIIAFDEYLGSGDNRPLLQATDFVPFKVRAEVIVTGSAHAPGDRPVPYLRARLVVGEVDKAIAILGDRSLQSDGTPTEPVPFTRMPLTWDHAAGGPGTANPIGILSGPAAPMDPWGRVRLPNLLPVSSQPPSRAEAIAPIGFGPISPSWAARRALLHHHAASWDPLRWAEKPLPLDFDGAYFQAAPPDQWLTELRPDEAIVLQNLHPQIADLATTLPRAVPLAYVETATGSMPLRLRCDTLVIDADRGLATLSYRGQIPLDHPQQAGTVVVSPEEPSEPGSETMVLSQPQASPSSPSVPNIESTPGRAATLSASLIHLLGMTTPADQTILPFQPSADPLPFATADSEPARVSTSSQPASDGEAAPESRAVLPFLGKPGHEAEPASVAVAPLPLSERADSTASLPFRPQVGAKIGAMALSRSMRLQVLPEPLPEPPPPSQTLIAPGLETMALEDPGLAMAETNRPPPGDDLPAPPPMQWAPPPALAPASFLDRALAPADEPPLQIPISIAGDTPLPPPLLVETASLELPVPIESASAKLPVTAPLAAPEPAAEPPLPLADYPLERCARIDAGTAMKPSELIAILEREDLTKTLWERLRGHYAEALDDESRRGKSERNRLYDAAYIARVEAERGPVTAPDYARLTVAVERSETSAALAELGLVPAAVPHLRRLWIQRLVSDPGLAKEVRSALRAARDAR